MTKWKHQSLSAFFVLLAWSIVAQGAITLTLVNADTDKDVEPKPMTNGMIVPPGNYSVRADGVASGTTSVQFGFDSNANFHTEGSAPYALNGNTGNDYNPVAMSVGDHTVSAKSLPNGESVAIKFKVSTSPPANPLAFSFVTSDGKIVPISEGAQIAPGQYALRSTSVDYAIGDHVVTVDATSVKFKIVSGGGGGTTIPTNPPPDVPPITTANFWVSTSGSDSADGSKSSPFRTIGKALSAAQPGQVIGVMDGVYSETLSLTKNSITIGAQNPGKAAINANGQETCISGSATNVTLQGMRVFGANGMLQAAHAMAKLKSGAKIIGCIFEECSSTGLALSGDNHLITDTIFRHCGQQGSVCEFTNNSHFVRCKWIENNNGVVNPAWKNWQAAGYPDSTFLQNGKYFVNPSWEAGGFKDWSCVGNVYDDCESYGHLGPCFWNDYKNQNITYNNCFAHDARGRSGKKYEGEGWRLELSSKDPTGGFKLMNCRVSRCEGAAVTAISVQNVLVDRLTASDCMTAALFRNDDSRGNLNNVVFTNVTATNCGTPPYQVWGSKPHYNTSFNGKAL